jgi:asparagine synthase (glutamine-hydrolysing)
VGALAVAFPRSSAPDPDVVRRMLLAAPHRGSEIEVRVCGRAVFGLSNDRDFRDAWLTSENGEAAVFSGALDNRQELNTALARAGTAVTEDNPASTVLAAFRTWGDGGVARLRGSFSGAVTDGQDLWCFRDQLGLRTLFFREDARAFLAGSEAKQVAAGAGIPRAADLEAAEDLFFGRLAERRTALKGVERFPKGSISVLHAEKDLSFRQYWDPSPLLETLRLSVPEACEALGPLLERAVSRSVTGNDAIALSGGIDSPAVAAIAAPKHLELGRRALPAISAVFPSLPDVDERRYTELVAENLGLPLHTYVQARSPLDQLDFWVDLIDGPWDALPTPWASERNLLARRLGARNLLTGDLAEYVFTMWEHLIGHLVLHGRWRATGLWVAGRRSRGVPRIRIAREIARSVIPRFAARPYVLLRKNHLRERDRGLMPPWLDADKFALGRRPAFERPARRRWLEGQLDPLRPAAWTSFEAADICAAHSGIHLSRPLADVDLWEFFLSLRAETKFPDSVPKSLIRRTMRGRLPDEVLDRRDKTIFDAHVRATADYPGLKRWILDSSYRMSGIDYTSFRSRVERREMGPLELLWAYNLARVHAFASVRA